MLMFVITISKSQTDSIIKKGNKRFIVSVAGGITMPFGVFAQYESENPTNIAGIAKRGFYYKFNFDYTFSKHGGITLVGYSSKNSTSLLTTAQLTQPFSGGLGGGSVPSSFNYTSNNWYTNAILVGLFGVKEEKYVTFNFRLSAGIQQVVSPESEEECTGYIWDGASRIHYPYDDKNFQPKLYSSNAVLNLGIDAVFTIYKGLKVKIGSELFLSQAKFNGSQTITNDGMAEFTNTPYHTVVQQNISFTKNIYLFCFNGGISYVIR